MARPGRGNLTVAMVLRKLMWSGLYAGLAAGGAMAARRLASKIWRVTTGEAPPAKK